MARDHPKDEPKRRLRVERNDDGHIERVVLEPSRPPLAPAWAQVDAASHHLDAREPRVPKPEPRPREVEVPRAPATSASRSFPTPNEADDDEATPLAPAWGGEAADEADPDHVVTMDPLAADEEDAGEPAEDEVMMTQDRTDASQADQDPADVHMLQDEATDPSEDLPLAPAWQRHELPPRRVGDATQPRVPALTPAEAPEALDTPVMAQATEDTPGETPLAPAWEGWEHPARARPTAPPRVPAREPGFVVLQHSIRGTASDEELEVATDLTLPRARNHRSPTGGALESRPHEGAPLAPAWASHLGLETRDPEAPASGHIPQVQVLEVEDAEASPEADAGTGQRIIYLPADLPATVDAITRSHLVTRDATTQLHGPGRDPSQFEVPPAAQLPPELPHHERIDAVVARYLEAFRATEEEMQDAAPAGPDPVEEAPGLPPEGDVPRKVDEVLARRRPWPGADGAQVPEDVNSDVDAVLARYERS